MICDSWYNPEWAYKRKKRKIQRECDLLQFARNLLVILLERNHAEDPIAQLDREQKMIPES
jgi:hypothetical protein